MTESAAVVFVDEEGVGLTNGNNEGEVQLSSEELLQRAQKSCGLTDFGDDWFREPLSELVTMINQEAGLTSANAPPVQAMIGNLADRLRLVDYLERNPAALDEAIEVPGIIIGLGRGGSTLLQRLLSASAQVNHTPWWELVFPLPLSNQGMGERATRIEYGALAAREVNAKWPELAAMHPIEALAPDEEIALFDRTPLSLMYCFYFNIPSYMPWLRRQNHERAYGELVTWLKVLQHQDPTRRARKWVLKSGHHLLAGGLRVMLDTFPNAKAIMTHRNLQNVIVSYCSLQSVTVRNFSANFDPAEQGPRAIWLFREALQDLISIRRDYPATRFVDVQYQDTVTRPLEVFRDTLMAMGMCVTDEDMAAARGWMSSHGRDTHPPHRYAAEQYGMSANTLSQQFEFYHQRFLQTG